MSTGLPISSDPTDFSLHVFGESSIEPFYHPVVLGVILSGVQLLDSKQFAHVHHQTRYKVCTVTRQTGLRHSLPLREYGSNPLDESICVNHGYYKLVAMHIPKA